VLGFAAELYEKGILTKKDLDGIEPEWANVEAFAALAEKVAFRKGIGDILAEGVYRAALKLGEIKGVDLLKYAVHGKGVAIGAHGVRSGEDFISEDIAYACSVQGGDHTSSASLPLDQGGELSSIMADSAIYCVFAAFGIEDTEMLNFYEAITGWKLTQKEWYKKKALRILQLQRAMLLLGGPDVKWKPKLDDDNPPRFCGWNENGVPKPETLRKLGLEDVEAKLRDAALIE